MCDGAGNKENLLSVKMTYKEFSCSYKWLVHHCSEDRKHFSHLFALLEARVNVCANTQTATKLCWPKARLKQTLAGMLWHPTSMGMPPRDPEDPGVSGLVPSPHLQGHTLHQCFPNFIYHFFTKRSY